jgi:hypothetical protein
MAKNSPKISKFGPRKIMSFQILFLVKNWIRISSTNNPEKIGGKNLQLKVWQQLHTSQEHWRDSQRKAGATGAHPPSHSLSA